MDYKAKAIELLGEKKKQIWTTRNIALKAKIEGCNQMHSKAVEVVEGLLETNEALEEEIRRLKHD